MRLKAAKMKTVEVQRILSEQCELLSGLEGEVEDRHCQAMELIKKYREAEDTLMHLRELLPSVPCRSVEELQGLLDEQSIEGEKKKTALERQRNAIHDLERLLAMHETENAKLEQNREELEVRRAGLSKKDGEGEKALTNLCRWYAAAIETISRLSGCQVEMVQPDYLVATITSVPVHIYVDPVSGKLQSVKVGSTSSTPKRQWKELIEAAIEFNDIPFLIRSIHAAINKN